MSASFGIWPALCIISGLCLTALLLALRVDPSVALLPLIALFAFLETILR
jgi:hypothetical protein